MLFESVVLLYRGCLMYTLCPCMHLFSLLLPVLQQPPPSSSPVRWPKRFLVSPQIVRIGVSVALHQLGGFPRDWDVRIYFLTQDQYSIAANPAKEVLWRSMQMVTVPSSYPWKRFHRALNVAYPTPSVRP